MARRKTQWHPLLAGLLRHEVEQYYELTTNLLVGDLPRQADIVLLRRTAAEKPPFHGLWRCLTLWNVLEYKGPPVAARREHLPFLVEVGLGIARRLNEQRSRDGERPTSEGDISFWYLANRLGRSFLRVATNRLGGLEELGNGIWQSMVLCHPVFLVSTVDLPVDEESLPLHVLGIEPMEQQIVVGQFLIETAERVEAYGSSFAGLHPAAWREVKAMAKSRRGGPKMDLDAVVDFVGGLDNMIKNLGERQLLEQMGIDRILANLSPAQRRELERRVAADSERKGS
jgi:hypothetical protein